MRVLMKTLKGLFKWWLCDSLWWTITSVLHIYNDGWTITSVLSIYNDVYIYED